MVDISPRFQRPLEKVGEPVRDPEYWEKANEAYDNKKYKESLIELINYINPKLISDKDKDKDINIVQSQGSVNIYVNITNDRFEIKAPFLKITDKTNTVALLRKVNEVNFESLMLAQIVLKNEDVLQFEFSEDIELCHPHKVYEVIREIAIYSDDYDDEFVERYDADFVQKAEIIPLTEQEKVEINKHLDQIIEDYKNYSKALKEKRLGDFRWDIIIISLLKLGIMPYVNGTLRTDLGEYIYNLLNFDIDFKFRLDKGVNFMNKLCDTPREEIMQNMYHSKQFFSLKSRSSLEILQDELKSIDNIIQQYATQKDNMPLFYFLQITFLRIIYYFNLEEHHLNPIFKALEKSANIKLKDAAKILFDLYNQILDGKIEQKKAKRKGGFFSRLFK